MSLAPGSPITDRYRLVRHIATGGMGAVWEAEDSVLGRHVAVKILKPEYSSDAEFVERFRAEAKVTARISHPGVAAVYDYGQFSDPDSGVPLSYLVMELVAGEPLSDVLARRPQLPLRHTLDMLEQTGRALNAAHAIGLVHRDVKPGNILITPSGQVKLTDFGIAKTMGTVAVTQTGMVVGTAQYIAPEQAMSEEATPAGDVYSLAVVGYECLAGRRPFHADNPVSLAMKHVREQPPALPDTVPARVRLLLEYAMAKDPARRYPDGAAFADAVAQVRADHDPTPPPGLPAAAAGVAAAPAGRPDPTKVLTRVHPSPPEPPATRPRTASRPRPAPPSRPVAPPPQQPSPARRGRSAQVYPPPRARRRGCGCGAWFALVLLLAMGAVAVAGYAMVRSGSLDPADLLRPLRQAVSSPSAPPPPQYPQPEVPANQEPVYPTIEPPTVAPPQIPSPDLGGELDSLLNSITAGLDPGAGPGDAGGAGGAPAAEPLPNGGP